MRISVLACILSGVAAICIYACVAHVVAARNQWYRSVHLIFAALASMAAVHAIAHIGMYTAPDVYAYATALRVANVAGAIVLALVPWLVQGYFAAGSRVAPTIVSALYLLAAAVDAYTGLAPGGRMPQLDHIVLPWGETATIDRLPSIPPALWIFWGGTSLLLVYLAVMSARGRRRGRPLQAYAIVASIAVLLLAVGANMLVLAGRLNSIFLGEFGFLALMLTMMHLLSGEESYRAIISQASTGIFVLSAQGRFLDVNRVGRRMLARSDASLRKMYIRDVVTPVAAPAGSLPERDDGMGSDALLSGLWELRRSDGSTVLVDMSAQVLSDGRVLYIVRDVTQSMRADRAIRLLAESGPAADPAAFAASCAGSLAEAFGVHHASIAMLAERGEAMTVVGCFPAHDRNAAISYPAASAPCARLNATRRSLEAANVAEEFPHHAPFAGDARAYLGSAIFSPAGKVVGVVEIWDERPFVAGPESRQILEMFAHRIGAELERAAADRELRHLTAGLEARIAARTSELAHANQELEAFSYSVSHDLRAPVRAVDANAIMLLDEAQAVLDPSARGRLERILQAARRMRELIDGLLALARLAHHSPAIETVDLSSIARQAMDLLHERDRSRRVQFQCTDNVSARADRTGASVILTNLLENAWKYSSRVDQASIEFGAAHVDGEIVYHVRDNGVGFDMQHAKHLFEPFRRLHAHGEYPGSGIGLATVARIVHRHGGRVWAQSAPGQGSTFYFTLQRREYPSVPATAQSPPAVIASGAERTHTG